MTPRIQQAIERHGLHRNVRMLGKVPEEMLGRLYRGADLFAMPNVAVKGDMEGFGVVMLEAGMCGMPVLAADLEGISDVVREGENGHLVRSVDAEGFEQHILRYRANAALRAEASRRAAVYTAGHFGWPAIADVYVRLLQQHTTTTTGTVPAELARAAG